MRNKFIVYHLRPLGRKLCLSFIVIFLLITIYYKPSTLFAALTDEYPCGSPDQIQVGTPQGDCEQNGQTCTAFSHYLYTDENTQAWCDNNNCAEPCTSSSTPTPAPTATLISTQLPEGTSVDLTNYFLPNPGQAAQISSGETFWIKEGQNGEYIQCTNATCINFQKIFITADGFGIQGENHWNNVPNTTFQYLQNNTQATWLPSNMKVGDTHSSGPITVAGFIISPDPNEGIIKPCDSTCDTRGAGTSEVVTKLSYVGPVNFGNNIKLNDVAVVDVVSGPGAGEKFYFAKDIGWVGWELNGTSNIINQPLDGSSTPNGNGISTSGTSSNKSTLTSATPTMGPEEKAVYKLNQGLLPEQLAKEQQPPVTEPDILKRFFDNLGKLIGGIFSGLFFNTIIDNPKMYVQSGNVDQSSVPGELVPKTDNVTQNIQDFLGKSTGIYGANLPKEVQGSDIKESERGFEQANFPAGINPITGNNKAK